MRSLPALLLMSIASASANPAMPMPAASGGFSPRSLQWVDGAITFTEHLNCLTNQVETLTGQYMGYYADEAGGRPVVDEVYYGHAMVSTVGNACNGVLVDVQVVPPRNTVPVVDSRYPVFCYYLPPPTSQNPHPQWIRITASCPQVPGIGEFGYRYDPVGDPQSNFWPLLPDAWIEIQFPLISREPLNGALEQGAELTGAIRAMDGAFNPLGVPFQWVIVHAADGDLLFRNGFD